MLDDGLVFGPQFSFNSSSQVPRGRGDVQRALESLTSVKLHCHISWHYIIELVFFS